MQPRSSGLGFPGNPASPGEEKRMNLDRPIVVVDRRTYRGARKRAAMLTENGDLIRAKSGLTAMRLWLRYEINTGPKRRRIRYAADLEQLELAEEDLNKRLGLAPPEPEAGGPA
jgi:hypothetical protein